MVWTVDFLLSDMLPCSSSFSPAEVVDGDIMCYVIIISLYFLTDF